MEIDGPTVWHLNARCLREQKPTSFFFPNLHGISGPGRAVILRQIGEYCHPCPVRQDCYEAGKSEEHGAWAGALRDEEVAMFRVQRRREQRASR